MDVKILHSSAATAANQLSLIAPTKLQFIGLLHYIIILIILSDIICVCLFLQPK